MVREAAKALTATGQGLRGERRPGAQWSAPDEESKQSAAMQLADVRMYAQKESRQVARSDALEPDEPTGTPRVRRSSSEPSSLPQTS